MLIHFTQIRQTVQYRYLKHVCKCIFDNKVKYTYCKKINILKLFGGGPWRNVTLGDMDRHFAWQAWHLWHWARSGGALGPEWTGWTPRLFAWQAWHFWDIHLTFTWQAWHLVTWIVTLRGMRGTYGIGLAPVARLGRRFLRGRRGTWWHRPALCVAAVAPGDMDRHFAWQAWHFWHWAGSGGALGPEWTGWTPRLFAWQAWHLVTWIVTLRGRRGTYGTGLALVARLGRSGWGGRRGFLRGRRGTTWIVTLRGRRGTFGTGLAPVARLGRSGRGGRRGFLRGRRGTWWHGSSLCVAGVALMALGWLWWRAWAGVDGVDAAAFCVAGVARHGSSLCVAGVALTALRWLRWRAWAEVGAVTALLCTDTCCGTCTFVYTVTCLCWMRFSYLRHL